MAGKQLSRLTSQDRVLTANDLFDPNERPHGAVMALKETKNLVDHSTQAHIFSTKAELETFVAEQSALSEGERTVKVGDNLYITDTGVPDYWWMGEAPWISVLESGAVNVTVDDALKADSANPVQNKVVKAALDKKLDINSTKDHLKWDDSPNVETTFGSEFQGTDKAAFLSNGLDHLGNYRGIAFKDGEIKWVDNSGNVHTETLGGGGGGFDPDVSAVVIGLNAVACGGKSIAIGESAWTPGGVAIGYKANSPADSVSIGGQITGCSAGGARSVACSVVIGAGACGQCWSVVVGYNTGADSYGTAVGGGAQASGHAVAIGGESYGVSTYTVAIGACARATACNGQGAIAIGPMLSTNENTAIAIGTDCNGLPLYNATIRVDYNGNLTVGGKPVGGGGDTAVEVWKGNVGFGEQDTFIGAKKTADGDGQFHKGYPRLHNHGQDIHEVSGFSRDSYEGEDVWSHRFVIPWDLAMANDMSYMAANVKWQGYRNLIGGMGCYADTTFVQPLMPANTGATSSVFPYAIPAFEESPVYWSGTIMYNDSLNADGTYSSSAKSVTVPWTSMCAPINKYAFVVTRDEVYNNTVKVVVGGVGHTQEASIPLVGYVDALAARVKTLEDKLAAVGA